MTTNRKRIVKSVTLVNARGNTMGNSGNRFITVGQVGHERIVLSPGGEKGADYDVAMRQAVAFAAQYGIKRIGLPDIPAPASV